MYFEKLEFVMEHMSKVSVDGTFAHAVKLDNTKRGSIMFVEGIGYGDWLSMQHTTAL